MDLIFADWANNDRADRSVLTIYKPLPYEGGKSTIVDDLAHERFRQEVLKELPAQLKDFGIPENAIEAMARAHFPCQPCQRSTAKNVEAA